MRHKPDDTETALTSDTSLHADREHSDIIAFFSRFLFDRILNLKDGGVRLGELKTLEETQWLNPEAARERQWLKLKNILNYAYKNTIYYRTLFDKIGVNPETIKTESDLKKIPFLTKSDVREKQELMMSGEFGRERLVQAKTGGSTGRSLSVYFDDRCQQMRYAAAIRSDRWAGWEIGEKKAALWGNPPKFDTLKKKLRNTLIGRTIYLDTMGLNEESMSDFVHKYMRFRPAVIFGHSHSIYMFARFVQSKGIAAIRPRGIIATSMMLIPTERRLIEETFGCKVTNRYGCEEVGLIACECERHRGMHLNTDHLYIEVIRQDGSPAGPSEEGAIVITDLINHGMPMIRYKVEDMGIVSERQCECGRGLPMLEEITGRVADFLVKKDGSLVAGVSLIERTLTAIKGIEQMQIVQEALEELRVNIVRAAHYGPESENALLGEMSNVFGLKVHIGINYMDEIPRESSGKFRFSICKIAN